MCYGATIWSGVRRLVIAGSGPECEELTGFDEGPVRDDWREQLETRGISVTSDVLREGALRTFAEDGASASTVYNARRD
jgi:tRNA(Arg) A34 adenosine deaminase TadA